MKTPLATAAAHPCPCGLPAEYGECCGRWHAGPLQLQAPDAERLMRSRYSAYTLGLQQYIKDSWHPRTRPASIDAAAPGLTWLGLQIRRFAQQDDTHATVEFVARHKLAGRAYRLHELSRFERIDGCWVYVDGDVK
jgi:SEC-C motif-containing protein